jgi:hypothetical protein
MARMRLGQAAVTTKSKAPAIKRPPMDLNIFGSIHAGETASKPANN